MTSAPRMSGGAHLQQDPVNHCNGSHDSNDALRSIDWHRCTLRSDTEAKEEAGNEEVPPCVREALPDTRDERNEGGKEDRATASKVLVHGRGDPAADNAAAQLVRKPVR